MARTVEEIMTTNPRTVNVDDTVQDAAGVMRDNDIGDAIVIEDGEVTGIVTDRDIVVRAVAEGKDCANTRAEEVMTTDVYTARPHERVVDVIRKMGDKQVRRIPVVNVGGKLLGIVSMGDIAVETEADRELADALEDISRESSFWGKIFG
jgi:CBS domain-containing protein